MLIWWTMVMAGVCGPEYANGQTTRHHNLNLGSRLPSDYYLSPSVMLPRQAPRCDQFIYSYFMFENEANISSLHRQGYTQQASRTSRDPMRRYVADFFLFSSPEHPRNYPENLDCFKVIQAPSRRQRVHLHFRENFQLENTLKCKNDFVEVRDGRFGFAPLIARFCGSGSTIAPIVSSGQYLWLWFHSDADISDGGFQAIYHFESITSVPESMQYSFYSNYSLSKGEVTVEQKELKRMWNTRDPVVDQALEPVEFLLEFTTDPGKVLLLSLQYSRFEPADVSCRFNKVEVYAGHTLRLVEKPKWNNLMRNSTDPWDEGAPTLVYPVHHVICNKPSMAPLILYSGRGLIRVIWAPQQKSKSAQTSKLRPHWPAELPKLLVVATVISHWPCRTGYRECKPAASDFEDEMTGDLLPVSTTEDVSQMERHSAGEPGVEASSILDESQVHEPHGLFCVPEQLFCNRHWNCPDKNDEEGCKKTTDDHGDDVPHDVKKTPKFRIPSDSNQSDGRFKYHNEIIAALLSFCALFSLASGLTTWFHHQKTQKKLVANLADELDNAKEAQHQENLKRPSIELVCEASSSTASTPIVLPRIGFSPTEQHASPLRARSDGRVQHYQMDSDRDIPSCSQAQFPPHVVMGIELSSGPDCCQHMGDLYTTEASCTEFEDSLGDVLTTDPSQTSAMTTPDFAIRRQLLHSNGRPSYPLKMYSQI